MAAAASLISTATNSTNQTTHDFGNFNAPTSGVLVAVVTFWGANNATVSSVSIDGSTTGVTIQKSNSSSDHKTVIASKAIATSGNKNITVTLSGTTGSFASAACSGFIMTGALEAQTASVEQSGSGASNPDNMVLNTTTSGVEFYTYVSGTNKQPASTGATIDYTASVNASWHSHGHRLTTAGETPRTESWTFSNNNAFRSVASSQPPSNAATTSQMNPGSFTLTGKTIGTGSGTPFSAGAFTFTGKSILYRQGYGGLLAAGAFTLTGKALTGTINMFGRIGAGSFALTGVDAGYRRAYRSLMGVGSFLAKGGWHSMRLDSTATTTNRIVNRKWWAGLLNGGR